MSIAAAPTWSVEARGAAASTAAIDASCAAPVLAFYGSAVFWLLVGSGLAFLASFKLHMPEFFADWAVLTFGRVRPAHVCTSVYGWASMAGIGTLLWLEARLCRVVLPCGSLLVAGCALWNVAVAAGTWAILTGGSSGIEWLELPLSWSLVLGAVLLLVMAVSLMMLAGRRERAVHVSQWYLLGAVLWFPLLYFLANLLIHGGLTRGVPEATASWWFAHNLLGLWLVPIGLATAYYVIPQVVGRPIYSYGLSLLGFWTLAVVYNWAGTHHLIGGPVPAWLITVGIAAGVLMLISVGAVALNHHMTMRGAFGRLRGEMALRFVVVGAMCYTLVSVQGALQGLRSINAVTHFTHYTVAHAHLGVYAFFTLVMFGALYHVVPQLTGRAWSSRVMIAVHFWAVVAGVAVYWVGLSIGGIVQGLGLNDPAATFAEVTERTIPFLGARSAAAYLMTIGHLVFAGLLVQMVFSRRGPTAAREGTA